MAVTMSASMVWRGSPRMPLTTEPHRKYSMPSFSKAPVTRRMAANNSMSFGFISLQRAVGFGGEFRAEPQVRQALAQAGGRIFRVAHLQAGQREFTRSEIRRHDHLKFSCGRGLTPQADENLLRGGTCVFGERAHGGKLSQIGSHGKAAAQCFVSAGPLAAFAGRSPSPSLRWKSSRAIWEHCIASAGSYRWPSSRMKAYWPLNSCQVKFAFTAQSASLPVLLSGRIKSVGI